MALKIRWQTIPGLLALGVCLAAEGASPVGNEVHSFHIPSEDATAAVRDFGLQSGVPISAELEDLRGKRCNAVAGELSVDAALQQLIAGTGLRYTYEAGRRAVSLTAAADKQR
jgi:hypothetical protein